ncbi:MAG TPA: glycosyltransferase family 4 protein [Gammaproteobacteria bacterium]|nr:glycosyltransferase family 4 protein [Gammaproteobacteria bacterium]
MPRIDFLVPGDIETLTGGYAYDRNLAASLRRAGWQIEICSVEDLTRPQARARAAALIDALPDDAELLIDGLALAELADVVARHRTRLRLSAVVHHPAGMETGLSRSAAADITRREVAALRSMHCIVCTSNWTARQLAGFGLAPSIVHVVEPGVDIGASAAVHSSVRRDPLAAHDAGLRLLCVATLTPRKGHDVLIEALGELTDVEWQLDCIGSRERAPQHAAHLAALIDNYGLTHRVNLRGEVSHADLALAYARSDLFVLASHLEGYGMVLAEARSAGLPIVATRGGAVAETLERGAAVVLIDPDSPQALAAALRGVCADRQGWLELARSAAACGGAARSWDVAAQEFAAALESRARR